jgi:hypothetical protein
MTRLIRDKTWFEKDCFDIENHKTVQLHKVQIILRRPQKFEKISHFFLTLLINFKKRWGMFSNFEAFLQYLNFNYLVSSPRVFGPTPLGLETRVIIKISTHPCQEPLNAFHGIKQKPFFFWKIKSKMADSKTLHFSKQSILNIFSPKLSGIGPQFPEKNIENWRFWKT